MTAEANRIVPSFSLFLCSVPQRRRPYARSVAAPINHLPPRTQPSLLPYHTVLLHARRSLLDRNTSVTQIIVLALNSTFSKYAVGNNAPKTCVFGCRMYRKCWIGVRFPLKCMFTSEGSSWSQAFHLARSIINGLVRAVSNNACTSPAEHDSESRQRELFHLQCRSDLSSDGVVVVGKSHLG